MLRRWTLPLALVAAIVLCAVEPATAEDTNPFARIDEQRARERERQRRAGAIEAERQALPPMGGIGSRPWLTDAQRDGAPGDSRGGESAAEPRGPSVASPAPGALPSTVEREALPALDEASRAVERGSLGPAMTGDGTGLPAGMWSAMPGGDVEKLVATFDLPARSPAMAGLWRRVWIAEGAGTASGEAGRFEALAIEALVRAGLVHEALTRADKVDAGGPGVLPVISARLRVAAGDRERGCTDVAALRRRPDLPKPVRDEFLLLDAYCAARGGDLGAAGLAAELARGEGVSSPFALSVLDAVAAGQKVPPPLPKRLALADLPYLQLVPGTPLRSVLERAEPALASALAEVENLSPADRVLATEVAAQVNAADAERLAAAWRSAPPADGDGAAAAAEPVLRRAALFRAMEAERTPQRKARLARQLLDEARRVGLETATAVLISRATESSRPVAEIGWFAETAIEVHLVAGRYDLARRWIEAADRERFDRGGSLSHWLVLVDLADPAWPGRRGEALVHAEQLSLRGRLGSDLLHRLATVLDALDYEIPIPLWEAASRTPQPRSGHLPETGALTRLNQAAKAREHARTVLLAFETLGPSTAEKANIIALGDVIRALRRAGLEVDARRLALEAVLPGWPRQQEG